MAKILQLNQSIHSLCSQYPELLALMVDLGFPDITKPGMLATAGRIMTLPKGAALRRLDLEIIKARLEEAGFEVQG